MVAFLALLTLLATTCEAIVAPDLSLETVPVGYFGGNAAHRGEANIEMLAKMRLVMIEKWEGNCWQDCLATPGSAACNPSCDAEAAIMDTMRRIKAVNRKVATVMYLNTLLAFPFYSLIGKYQSAGALAMDSVTKKPIQIRNDNGMENIYVYGFDTPKGQQLYLDAIKNYTDSGLVDGFFGDKWNKGASPVNWKDPAGGWNICNKECGNVTALQARLWNEGKAKVLLAATAYVGQGPYFSYGYYSAAPEIANVSSNLDGSWNPSPGLKPGTDPRAFISAVQGWLHGSVGPKPTPAHQYVFMNSQGDQHWTTDPNDPASLQGSCVGDCLARFLLGVERGVILGTDGWDESYAKPLGDPLGPALFTPSAHGEPATLTRSFKSGTKVVFTYSNKTDPEGTMSGTGEVWWGGVKPKPPPPPPPPPTIQCGAGCGSTLLQGVPFAGGEVKHQVTASAAACCAWCATAGPACTQWTWHTTPQGASYANMTCHQHSSKAKAGASKPHVVSGVMNRTAPGDNA